MGKGVRSRGKIRRAHIAVGGKAIGGMAGENRGGNEEGGKRIAHMLVAWSSEFELKRSISIRHFSAPGLILDIICIIRVARLRAVLTSGDQREIA